MPRRNALDGVSPAALAYRPAAVSRAKRSREWDRRQRSSEDTCQVCYRGIPRELSRRIGFIAEQVGITVSEVARILLEAGMESYERQDFEIVVRGREK